MYFDKYDWWIVTDSKYYTQKVHITFILAWGAWEHTQLTAVLSCWTPSQCTDTRCTLAGSTAENDCLFWLLTNIWVSVDISTDKWSIYRCDNSPRYATLSISTQIAYMCPFIATFTCCLSTKLIKRECNVRCPLTTDLYVEIWQYHITCTWCHNHSLLILQCYCSTYIETWQLVIYFLVMIISWKFVTLGWLKTAINMMNTEEIRCKFLKSYMFAFVFCTIHVYVCTFI